MLNSVTPHSSEGLLKQNNISSVGDGTSADINSKLCQTHSTESVSYEPVSDVTSVGDDVSLIDNSNEIKSQMLGVCPALSPMSSSAVDSLANDEVLLKDNDEDDRLDPVDSSGYEQVKVSTNDAGLASSITAEQINGEDDISRKNSLDDVQPATNDTQSTDVDASRYHGDDELMVAATDSKHALDADNSCHGDVIPRNTSDGGYGGKPAGDDDNGELQSSVTISGGQMIDTKHSAVEDKAENSSDGGYGAGDDNDSGELQASLTMSGGQMVDMKHSAVEDKAKNTSDGGYGDKPAGDDNDSGELQSSVTMSGGPTTDTKLMAVDDAACCCAIQCPYCFFAIASVRLLRQHIVFHVAMSDAVSTPVFQPQLDSVEDGRMDDVRCTDIIQLCGRCRHFADLEAGTVETSSSDSYDHVSSLGNTTHIAVSALEEKITFLSELSLRAS